jgi:hypothetical protein
MEEVDSKDRGEEKSWWWWLETSRGEQRGFAKI